ncbi:MAG: hypothetical protein ABI680_16025, partial [Chthoniobacteraceae bacterium]
STVPPTAMLKTFAPGAVVSIIVQAVNVSAQSVPSAAVEVTIPLASPAPMLATAPLPEPPAYSNGNGAPATAISMARTNSCR